MHDVSQSPELPPDVDPKTLGTHADFVKANWQRDKFRRIRHSTSNRVGRVLWAVAYRLLFRLSPRPFHRFRANLLRMFGAKIAADAKVHPTTKFWAPWNLEMHPGSRLGEDVDCYCVGKITIGENVTVSQRVTLCGASHDTTLLHFPLVVKPIVLEPFAWIAAQAFVMPGVTIGEGTVVGALSLVTEDLPPWKIAAGIPCKVLGNRKIRVNESDEPRDANS